MVPNPPARFPDIADELDHLRRQVHSLTIENARLRKLLPRDALKSHRKPTRREKQAASDQAR